jgi:hypothetical protein
VDKILDDLKEAKAIMGKNNIVNNEDSNSAIEQVNEVSKEVTQNEVKTVEVLVSKAVKAEEVGVSSDDIKVFVIAQIGKILEKIQTEFNEIKETAHPSIDNNTTSTSYGVDSETGKLEGINTSTELEGSSTSTELVVATDISKDTEQKLQEAGEQIEKTLIEAKDLLEQKDLVNALVKIKELVITNSEISSVIDESIKKMGISIVEDEASTSTEDISEDAISTTTIESEASTSTEDISEDAISTTTIEAIPE